MDLLFGIFALDLSLGFWFGILVWDLGLGFWFGILVWDLGLGSEARGILESGWGNRAGGVGGIGRGGNIHQPFKTLSKNPSRQSLVRK